MRYLRSIMALASLTVGLTGCDSDDSAGPDGGDLAAEPRRVVQANGDLTAALTEFRGLLGEPANGGGAGPQAGGRREIRWDGVPPEQSNTDAFPADFFGAVFDRPIVARVEVASGEAPLGAGRLDLSSGGTHDLAVTDDFLFGEPQAE